VNVLVIINYRLGLTPHDLTNPNSSLIKEVHYFVSNDTNHDTLFVQHVFMFIGAIYKIKGAFQTIKLFGKMVVHASLKV
jgi:hypothetical protein